VAYVFFDHTGDVGVTVRAPSLDNLFAGAALALTDTMTDRRLVGAAHSSPVELRASGVDLLLVEWLNELIYRFDTGGWLVAGARIEVVESGGQWMVRGAVDGETLDPGRHPIRTLVKAATYHALSVTFVGGEWEATVVLDV
jgi:protein archease